MFIKCTNTLITIVFSFIHIQEDKLQLNGINIELKSLNKQPLPIVRFYTPDEDSDGIKGKELRIEPRLKHSTIRGSIYLFIKQNKNPPEKNPLRLNSRSKINLK